MNISTSAALFARALVLMLGTRSLLLVHAYRFEFTGNPLVSHVSSADPSAHVWDGKVWVYTSKDGNLLENGHSESDPWTYAYMDGYHAFSSTDMVNWVDHGEIFHSRDVSWGGPGWMWAPSAARKNGKVYLYYPKKDWEGNWRLGIAVANRPQGPFEDIGEPLDGVAGIDPMVLIDDDGEAYLYLNDHQVAKLKPNMIELAEAPRNIDYAPSRVLNDPEKQFEEGSFVHKYNGQYIFSYSNWQALSDTAYYAIGDSPYGPFEWQGALAGETRGAPDHHSIINFQGQWYYFYHMDTPWQEKAVIGWHGHRRLACFDKLYHNSDGTIQKVQRTYGEPISIPEAPSNPCDSNPCNSRSTCIANGSSFECQYNDPCDSDPCDEDETCIDRGNGRHRCRYNDPCDPDPCGNTGACVDRGGGNYVCEAIDDPCDPNPCEDYETCSVRRNGRPRCRYNNPCADPDPCGGTATTCVDLGFGNYDCEAPQNSIGSSNPCDSDPCQDYEKCRDKGNGDFVCRYNNPCRPNPCRSGKTCVDLGFGSHECQRDDTEDGDSPPEEEDPPNMSSFWRIMLMIIELWSSQSDDSGAG